MSLIKIRVQWGDTNKVVQLDRTKPNLYERLMMQLAMTIEEDIMLFDGPMILSGETALVAAIDDCVRTHQPHLQLTARVNKMKKSMQAQTPRTAAAPVTTSTPRTEAAPAPKAVAEPAPKKAAAPVAAGDACPECGHAINGKKFCMNCGAKAPEPKKEEPKPEPKKEEPKKAAPPADGCPECGHPLGGKKFCTNCGAKAPEPKKEEPTPAPKKEEPKPEPKKDLCPSCQFEWGTAKFCTNCGHKRGEAPKKDEPKPPAPAPSQPSNDEIPKPVTAEGDMEHCGRCGKEIGGGIKAMDRVWHSECFKCVGCGCSFGAGKQLMGHEGNPICAECYGERFGEKCDVCKRPLQGGYVKVGNMMMHPECLCCSSCGKQITAQIFRRDGKIVCGDCV